MTTPATHPELSRYQRAAMLHDLLNDTQPILMSMVAKAVDRFHDANDELTRLDRSIINTLDRCRLAVLQGRHVNERGELQTSAVDFDRACSLRQRAAEDVQHLAGLARKHCPNDGIADTILALIAPVTA